MTRVYARTERTERMDGGRPVSKVVHIRFSQSVSQSGVHVALSNGREIKSQQEVDWLFCLLMFMPFNLSVYAFFLSIRRPGRCKWASSGLTLKRRNLVSIFCRWLGSSRPAVRPPVVLPVIERLNEGNAVACS